MTPVSFSSNRSSNHAIPCAGSLTLEGAVGGLSDHSERIKSQKAERVQPHDYQFDDLQFCDRDHSETPPKGVK